MERVRWLSQRLSAPRVNRLDFIFNFKPWLFWLTDRRPDPANNQLFLHQPISPVLSESYVYHTYRVWQGSLRNFRQYLFCLFLRSILWICGEACSAQSRSTGMGYKQCTRYCTVTAEYNATSGILIFSVVVIIYIRGIQTIVVRSGRLQEEISMHASSATGVLQFSQLPELAKMAPVHIWPTQYREAQRPQGCCLQ